MAATAIAVKGRRGPRSSLLSDALVRDLVATGQVDVVVGLPTLDNADTVRDVVRAVHDAFAGPLARERTMLLNADGGSTDGTPGIVRGESSDPLEIVTAAHTLRTVHRVTAPHDGVPGRGGALHLVFAAADLLRARVIAVVDADATSLSAETVSRLVEPVLRGEYDFVKPVVARSPWEAPLVTQLVRPLMRAAYGKRLLEPLTTQFACSGALATEALSADVWDESFAQFGLDAWLAAVTMGGKARIAQVWMPAAAAPARARRAHLAEVFEQVVGGVMACLEADAGRWLAIEGSDDVPLLGDRPAVPSARPAFDVESFASMFTQGVHDLGPLLGPVLGDQTLEALTRASESSPLHISDVLWVSSVHAALIALHRRMLPRVQIVQSMLPIYLGRVASFFAETASMDVEQASMRLEELARAFEDAKPTLASLWNTEPTRR